MDREAFHSAFHERVIFLDDDLAAKLHVYIDDGPTYAQWCLHYFGKEECQDEVLFKGRAPGERPDTIVVKNIPIEWLGVEEEPKKEQYFAAGSKLRKAFEQFGKLRDMAVTVYHREGYPFSYGFLDPEIAAEMSPEPSISRVAVCDVYAQYRTYAGFRKAMASLANCYVEFSKRLWVEEEATVLADDELQTDMMLGAKKVVSGDANLWLLFTDILLPALPCPPGTAGVSEQAHPAILQ